jgi:predicted MFS family arabinose efflux permease
MAVSKGPVPGRLRSPFPALKGQMAAVEKAPEGSARVVAALGTTQTIAWASSYYLPAVLVDPIARDLGLPADGILAAFSFALVVSALASPLVGRLIDRAGGRGMLCASNLVLAAGLALLASAQGVVTLVGAWAMLGLGMGMGLYDSAFAALARAYGTGARGPITGITLIAGFASTIGWPVTAALDSAFDWRTACLFWAVVHVAVCLPLNRLLLPKEEKDKHAAPSAGASAPPPKSTPQEVAIMCLLAFAFASAWFVTGAMATHLPRLLQAGGATPAQAIAFAALVGPAQVAARVAEFALIKHVHPVYSARFAASLHSVGAVFFALLGVPGMAAFAILHGAGNGLLTIAKGTVPLALLGPAGYGYRQGLMSAPARLTQASSPVLFGLLVTRYGADALWFSAALTLIALVALCFLRAPDMKPAT